MAEESGFQNRVTEVKKWFVRTDDDQLALHQDIFNLRVDIRSYLRKLKAVPLSLQAIEKGVVSIESDFFNVLLLIRRLEWLRTTAQPRETVQELWHYMVGLDVELFHVTMRALMDYAASAVAGATADSYGKIPNTSFYTLYDWTNKNKNNRQKLGKKLTSLVSSATWLLELRNIRDAIVHRGGRAMGFGKPEDGILFQVYKQVYEQKNHPKQEQEPYMIDKAPLMNSKKVVGFQLYSAFYLVELLVFLKRLVDCIRTRFVGLKQTHSEVLDPGVDVFHTWLTRLEKTMGTYDQ